MKRRYLHVAAMGIVAVMFIAIVGSTSLLPRFADTDECEGARVTVYTASYTPATRRISVDVQNPGSTLLELRPILTQTDGTYERLDQVIFLTQGNRDVFTVSNVAQQPAELTLRDEKCSVADLWKF